MPVLISKLTSFMLKSKTNDYKLGNTYVLYDHSTSISDLLNVKSFGTVLTAMIKHINDVKSKQEGWASTPTPQG